MNYIRGRVRNLIYENNNGYKIGLFRVKETNDQEMMDFVNKTITFTGTFINLNNEDLYEFRGEYVYHERFGHQYKVNSYERILPNTKDHLIEFLSSSLVKGCGTKTAFKIVETLGNDCLQKIKENPDVLSEIKGLSKNKQVEIYESILAYGMTDNILLDLQKYGFSIKEATELINIYDSKIMNIIDSNIYVLKERIPFSKLDKIYLNHIHNNPIVRNKACILEGMLELGQSSGNTYHSLEEIYLYTNKTFNLNIDQKEFEHLLLSLENDSEIVHIKEKYFLKAIYQDEDYIASFLSSANALIHKHANYSKIINDIEERLDVKYNNEQRLAIESSLNHHVSIISGGPGTGKTTIINAICESYIRYNHLDGEGILTNIALLAPTGRASKRMAEATKLNAMTIHRYLKWNKDTNNFTINEYNKNYHKLIIIDEVSMIDVSLFAALLKGITKNVTLVLVGDPFQLPSVKEGNLLNDLINSNKFNNITLKNIYRQTSNSYIPILAEEVRNKNISGDFTEQKDDYNFLEVGSKSIRSYLEKILIKSKEKGLTERNIQVLAPLYKGENGIDLLNMMIRDIFNPEGKNSVKIGDTIYKEKDKVLQLVNDPDNLVYNGDIGYIDAIDIKNNSIIIDFDGNYVEYKREDLYNIKHAYAISIHKSQGSEFSHVIMPVTNSYNKMLYNKLIYTGISRAKKSLVIIGSKEAFFNAINNDYSSTRKTYLMELLDVYFEN